MAQHFFNRFFFLLNIRVYIFLRLLSHTRGQVWLWH